MNFTPETAAMRWGYGLPLPSGAATDSAQMLALLAGPDIAGSTRPLPQMTALVPLLDGLRLKKKPSKKDPALREEVKAIEAALVGVMYDGMAATFASTTASLGGAIWVWLT